MIKKKLVTLGLVASLSITTLIGCGAKEEGVTQPIATKEEAVSEDVVAVEETAEETVSDAAVAETEYTFVTRELRKGGDAKVLATPTEYVVERDTDQATFDSYVWSIDKLKENYEDVIILDARTKEDYDKGHLPGAVQAHWKDWSDVSVAQDNGEWALIYDNDKLAELFASIGIDGTKPVIVYNDPIAGWGEEGRQVWTLRVAGITDSYILNGGLTAWKAAGGEVTSEKTDVVAVEKGTFVRDESLLATTDYLSQNYEKVNVLDTREDEEFAGITNYGEKSLGRIPNSQHVWFKDFYHEDGTLLTPAETRARLEPLGFTTDEEVVTYCTGGIRSGFSAIALKIAGYESVKNYNVSFSGWSGLDQTIDQEVYSELSVVNN